MTIYLDNAATSWPKPGVVVEAMTSFMQKSAANPGRGGHSMAIEAARVVFQCREALGKLLNVADSRNIVFAPNATSAINTALWGYLKPGDHCVTSSLEHNAIMRPLHALQERGVQLTVVDCDVDDGVQVDAFAAALKDNTRLIAITHASNVSGTLFPVKDIAILARDAGVRLLVDAAQTSGVVPIDVQDAGIDLLAAPGHKSLLGPMGTGFLYVSPEVKLETTIFGGTGSNSHELSMPEETPDRFEAGTLNGPGIAGLFAGLRWLFERGIDSVAEHENTLVQQLRRGLGSIPGVLVYGSPSAVPVVSFNVRDIPSVEVSAILDASFNIATRAGIHCAPAAHKTLGTLQQGTVRVSPGPFNTLEDIEALLEAVEEIATC